MPDQRTYTYDAAGRLQTVSVDSNPNDNQSHSYDELDRLTLSQRGDAGQNSVGYAYDDNGNRSEQTVDAATSLYDIDPASNRVNNQIGIPSAVYSYDAAGNLIGDGIRTYGYDGAGRRITAGVGVLTTNYGYDSRGLRVSKTDISGTTYFVYDPQGHLTGEYDGQGQAIREIVWLGDLPVAVLIPAAPGQADVYYIHTDPLGTPRQITRAQDNQPVWRWESDPFGTTQPEQNPAGLGNFVFNLRFPGQYYDAEIGLHYNVFRDYDPRIGRYIQSDPIGLAGGINTYAYVGNNPVNWVDPFGLVVDPDPDHDWASANFGSFVHNVFHKEYTLPNGYQGENTYGGVFNRFEPDVYLPNRDNSGGEIWELKPKNCEDIGSDKRKQAESQLNKYIRTANNKGGSWTLGDPNMLLPEPVIRTGIYNGRIYTIKFFADPTPQLGGNSGLVFYEIIGSKKECGCPVN